MINKDIIFNEVDETLNIYKNSVNYNYKLLNKKKQEIKEQEKDLEREINSIDNKEQHYKDVMEFLENGDKLKKEVDSPLYVEIESVNDIKTEDIKFGVKFITEKEILKNLNDTNELVNIITNDRDKQIKYLEENNIEYTDILYGANDLRVFMKYNQFAEVLLKKLKLEVLSSYNCDLSKEKIINDLAKKPTKRVMCDDIVQFKLSNWVFDAEEGEDVIINDAINNGEKITIHFNDFINSLKDNGFRIAINDRDLNRKKPFNQLADKIYKEDFVYFDIDHEKREYWYPEESNKNKTKIK